MPYQSTVRRSLLNSSFVALIAAGALWAAPIAGATQPISLNVRERAGEVVRASFSADGRMIGLATSTGNSRMAGWVMNGDGTGLRRLSPISPFAELYVAESGTSALSYNELRGTAGLPKLFALDEPAERSFRSRGGEAFAPDGSLFFQPTRASLRRLSPTGATTRVRISPKPTSKRPEFTFAGARGPIAWCDYLRPLARRRLGIGVLDMTAGVLKLHATGVAATNGYGGCVAASNGRSVAARVSTAVAGGRRYQNRVVAWTRGHGVHRVASVGRDLSMSPTGRYALDWPSSEPCTGGAPSRRRLRLSLIDFFTGRARSASVVASRLCETPVWSPDGRTVVIQSNSFKGSGRRAQHLDTSLQMFDAATGRRVRVASPVQDSFPSSSTFTPNSERLIFCDGYAGEDVDWYSVTRDGKNAVKLTSASFRGSGCSNVESQRGIWFAGDRAWIRDSARELFYAPAVGFGETPLVP